MSSPQSFPEEFLDGLVEEIIDAPTRAALDRLGYQDNEAENSYLIFGAPGTGKTTAIEYKAREEWKRRGPHALLLTGFARASAKELTGRNLPLEPQYTRTLHAHCFHLLGEPRIAEKTKDAIEAWNQEHPEWLIERQWRGASDLAIGDEEQGEEKTFWLDEIARFRGLLHPRLLWPKDLQDCYQAWCIFKKHHNLVDFPDLIDLAKANFRAAPGNPEVLFTDEAQDMPPQQLDLIWQWNRAAEFGILAGDDDQAIFGWMGASARALLAHKLPEDHKLVLGQSHRLPRRVHTVATRWIKQVEERQPKNFRPRDAEGMVAYLEGSYGHPEWGILDRIEQELAAGGTVMVLASCAYMLKPLGDLLREDGIPFHNPYRPEKYGWNPLSTRKGGPSEALRALTLARSGPIARAWRAYEVKLWAKPLAHVYLRGGRKRLEDLPAEQVVSTGDLEEIFEPQTALTLATAFQSGVEPLIAWWSERLGANSGRYQMPVKVATERGLNALSETPRLILGTIHSVKGAQADSVILFPDLSTAAMQTGEGAESDGVTRLFYVGMTRSRERLFLVEPSSNSGVSWESVLRGIPID